MAQKTQKKQQWGDANTSETLRALPGDVASSFVNDFLKASVTDSWEQFLGGSGKKSGDLHEGQELDLFAHKKKVEVKKTREAAAPALDYHREITQFAERASYKETGELHTKIQEIIIELKRIASSSKELQVAYKEVTVEQRIQKPGKYHMAFFEWMLNVIHAARLKVEDSAAWLSMFKSKKGEKQYWAMFKKHGTSFGMSGERMVSTQTG